MPALLGKNGNNTPVARRPQDVRVGVITAIKGVLDLHRFQPAVQPDRADLVVDIHVARLHCTLKDQRNRPFQLEVDPVVHAVTALVHALQIRAGRVQSVAHPIV